MQQFEISLKITVTIMRDKNLKLIIYLLNRNTILNQSARVFSWAIFYSWLEEEQ